MRTTSNITILTPTYDDWESVFVLLDNLDGVLSDDGLTANIVVIDDGSPDFVDIQKFHLMN